MKNENNKLIISLDELQEILDYAKNQAEFHNMCYSLSIENKNNRITITQHCGYPDCNSIYHVT